MKMKEPDPKPISANSMILLVFMPPKPASQSEQTQLKILTDSLQQNMGERMRIVRIDESFLPDIFRSFEINDTPTFVLVRQGLEIWRQVGIPGEDFQTILTERLRENSIEMR